MAERATGQIQDRIFNELPELLRPDDLLVLNEAAVRPARLFAKRKSGGRVEVFLLEKTGGDEWQAMLKPGRRITAGEKLQLEDGATVEIISWLGGGKFTLRLPDAEREMETLGHMPLPPYIARPDDARDRVDYQTVFARSPTAAAAPTAGLHFTPELLSALRARGIESAAVNLAVGLGTFQPLPDAALSEIRLHQEHYTVPSGAAIALTNARAAKRRLVAVGTTACRVIESQQRDFDEFRAGEFSTELFLKPGDKLRTTDALLTNFHAPGTSLLCLLAAFLGDAFDWKALYAHALTGDYRFLSYGDAMLIL